MRGLNRRTAVKSNTYTFIKTRGEPFAPYKETKIMGVFIFIELMILTVVILSYILEKLEK